MGNCSKRLWRGFGFSDTQCTRKAVVEHNGIGFCKQHDPVARKQKLDAKTAAMQAAWKREDAEQARRKRIQSAETEIIAQARVWFHSGRDAVSTAALALAVQNYEKTLEA